MLPGLNPINKKYLRILTNIPKFLQNSQNSDKILRILKIIGSAISMCSRLGLPAERLKLNIQRKIFRNLSSQLQQNILSENFSDFLKNLVGSKF